MIALFSLLLLLSSVAALFWIMWTFNSFILDCLGMLLVIATWRLVGVITDLETKWRSWRS